MTPAGHPPTARPADLIGDLFALVHAELCRTVLRRPPETSALLPAARLADGLGFDPSEDYAAFAARLGAAIVPAPTAEEALTRRGALLAYQSALTRHTDRATDQIAEAFNHLESIMARMGRNPGRERWSDELRACAYALNSAAAEQAAAEALRAAGPAVEGSA